MPKAKAMQDELPQIESLTEITEAGFKAWVMVDIRVNPEPMTGTSYEVIEVKSGVVVNYAPGEMTEERLLAIEKVLKSALLAEALDSYEIALKGIGEASRKALAISSDNAPYQRPATSTPASRPAPPAPVKPAAASAAPASSEEEEPIDMGLVLDIPHKRHNVKYRTLANAASRSGDLIKLYYYGNNDSVYLTATIWVGDRAKAWDARKFDDLPFDPFNMPESDMNAEGVPIPSFFNEAETYELLFQTSAAGVSNKGGFPYHNLKHAAYYTGSILPVAGGDGDENIPF